MEFTNLITDLYKYNTGYLIKHITPMDKSRLFVRPQHNLNPIVWILGHIVVSRASMVEMLGDEIDMTTYSQLFGTGAKPLNDPSDYPHIDEIMGKLGRLGARLTRLLDEGGETLLNRQVWGAYDSIGKYIVNGYIHETYHIGQITYLINMIDKMNSARTSLKLATKKKNGTGKLLLDSLKSVLTVK